MKNLFQVITLSLVISSSAFAVVSEGDQAPDFSAHAITNSEQAPLSLATLLSRGPVVLYFFSSASATDCTNELRALSNSMGDFGEFHTSLVGIVNTPAAESDLGKPINCESQLTLVSDPEQSIADAYDVGRLSENPGIYLAVVISPESEVIHVHASSDVHDLIGQSLDAVQDWSQLVDQEY